MRETNELQERSDANIKSHTALDEASSDDVSEFSNGARAQGNFHVQRHTSPGVDQETQIDKTESHGDEFVAGTQKRTWAMWCTILFKCPCPKRKYFVDGVHEVRVNVSS